MGCDSSSQTRQASQKEQMIVASLNYGGIMNSPLQFFSDSQKQEHQLSQIFRALIPEYVSSFNQKTFKWDVGKIDQKVQKQRYSPIYTANVGVQKGKLVGKKQFQNHWDQCFKAATSKKKIQPEPTEQQVKSMRMFDFICYHTLLKFVYKLTSFKEVQTENLKPAPYIQLTQKYFSRSYLNQQKKIKKVRVALIKHSADVFFFQQPTKGFIEQLKKDQRFYVKQKGPDISILLIRKTSFKKIDNQSYLKNKLSQKQLKQLDWNGDTSYIVCDKYIFFSGHLSSKKEKNALQVQQMKNSLRILRQKCPDYEIVVGADANSFVTTQGIQDFQTFPNINLQFTTCKKRTFMQPQFNKADIINQQCKDQIFSTLRITKSAIVTILNGQVDKQKPASKLLPTDDHPFDHFMVLCHLQKK